MKRKLQEEDRAVVSFKMGKQNELIVTIILRLEILIYLIRY